MRSRGHGMTCGPGILVTDIRNQINAMNKTSDPKTECWREGRGGKVKINA